MPPRKRKRSRDKDYACFPGEEWLGSKKSDAGTVVSSSSVSEAWLRCGEGFAGSSTHQTLGSCERIPQIFQVPPLTSAEGTSATGNCKSDIVWSSSDSALSDEENETLFLSLPNPKRHTTKMDTSYNKRNPLFEDKSSEGEEQQLIDWEKDSEPESEVESCQWSRSEKSESAVQISDSDSCPSSISLNLAEQQEGSSKPMLTDISQYSSDNDTTEDDDRAEAQTARLGHVQKQMLSYGTDQGQPPGKTASDWLKSAQALLQTPEKQRDNKSSKTPEDSAKKRKRFLRGGLAERLNRLQNRERSAISFWRHQCVSDHKIPSGNRSGVLVIKIVQVHEECSMQVAVCQQLGILPVDSSPEDAPPDTTLKVLFNKDTAAQLKGAPQDIIHIYPPWQKLILHNENFPVVMNTHFSQKVFTEEKEQLKAGTHCTGKLLARKKIVSLSWIFTLNNVQEQSQVNCSNAATPATAAAREAEGKHQPTSQTMSDSLLEAVETQGAAGWRSVHVRVVVQRVYCLPARDQGRTSVLSPSILHSAPSNIRLCLLIQDGYGIFSELQLHSSYSSPDDLEKCWEGKTCCLTGIKILQRTTRGRAPGLFNLIDSLWPPLVPIKIHGQSQGKEEMKPNSPPPSFCYILAAHPNQGSVDFTKESEISELYLPPVVHSLREILQVVGCSHRCSFCATVIYRRVQAKNNLQSGQREFWLFVTDMDLQQTDVGAAPRVPKVLPVGVSPSCIVSATVGQALAGALPCAVFFKDAVRENGRIICVERTVLTLQKPPLCTTVAVDLSELTGPVKLDELDSTTQPNSLCSVQGTVVGVNEATALSWPACNRCDNGKLEQYYQDRSSLYCRQCSQAVTAPALKMQLEVFLQCLSTPRCSVKVKLQQKTISSLLGSPATEDGSYELTSVLGKEVGLLPCYLLSAISHPSSCAALEEIDLPEAARK